MVPLYSYGISRVPHYSGYCHVNSVFVYRTFTFFGLPSQAILLTSLIIYAVLYPKGITPSGLGSFHFARHYSGNRCFFLFLQVLRCFSSLRSLHYWCRTFSAAGSPIRNPADQLPFADPRGFSQLATSFIAGGSQGIPRTPFSYCSVNLVAASSLDSAA